MSNRINYLEKNEKKSQVVDSKRILYARFPLLL